MTIESKLSGFDIFGLASKFIPTIPNLGARAWDFWGMLGGSKYETGKIALTYVPVNVIQRDTETRKQVTLSMPGILTQVYNQSTPQEKTEWDKPSYPGIPDILGSLGKYAIIIIIAIVLIILFMKGDK